MTCLARRLEGEDLGMLMHASRLTGATGTANRFGQCRMVYSSSTHMFIVFTPLYVTRTIHPMATYISTVKSALGDVVGWFASTRAHAARARGVSSESAHE